MCHWCWVFLVVEYMVNQLFNKGRTLRNLNRMMVLGLLVISVNFASAQFETKKGQFNIGVDGGIQFTDIRSFGSIYQPSSKIGYTIGAFGDYYISNDFRLRLALNFDNRAFQINSNLPLADTSGKIGNSYYLYQVDYKLNYLTIPFGVIYTRGGDKFKILLQLSFYYSIFLNSTMNGGEDFYIAPEDIGSLPDDSELLPGHNFYAYDGSTTGLAYAFNSKTEHFNSYDFGFNFLIGGLYQVTPTVGITLSLGFTYGLANVYENTEWDSRWSQMTKVNLGIAYTLWK